MTFTTNVITNLITRTLSTRLPLVLVLMSALLSACGFQLRGGAVDLPPQLQTLQLQGAGGNSDLLQAAQRGLRTSGVNLVEDSQEGVFILNIGSEQLSERVISISGNSRAGEYELTMSVPIQLSSTEDFILTPETLSVERVYLADANNAAAKTEEAELLKTEMRQALVNQILRRLQSLSF